MVCKKNFSIFFCWVPGHICLSGDEKVDIAVKEAFSLSISECQMPTSDLRPVIKSYIINVAGWNGMNAAEISYMK